MTSQAIEVVNLWKTYHLYSKPIDRLKEVIDPRRRKYHRDFNALEDVSFVVEKGSTAGIVGKNGSGKSTLLKIICGVISPSQGQVEVAGRISALLELGAGFNPELTGRENIFFAGAIMGMSQQQIRACQDEVIEFADIGEFVEQPVKTYSSGMYVRLAFAMATCVKPDILIVDEALSVGDMFFQIKCMRRIKSMMDRGCTTIFVSHDINSVKRLCSNVLYLNGGKVREYGLASTVCDLYVKDQLQSGGFFAAADTPPACTDISAPKAFASAADIQRFESLVSSFRKGSGEARIALVQLLSEDGGERDHFSHGETMIVRTFVTSNSELDSLVCAFYIRDKNQVEVIGSNSIYEGSRIGPLSKNATWQVDFKLTNYLKEGDYSLQILLADSLSTTAYFDWIDLAAVFRAGDRPGRTRWALVNPPIECISQPVEF
jgi:ABC-type polysaccharide/polyol phosphate transport system ATPase subunit